jgi:hypothetical protein
MAPGGRLSGAGRHQCLRDEVIADSSKGIRRGALPIDRRGDRGRFDGVENRDRPDSICLNFVHNIGRSPTLSGYKLGMENDRAQIPVLSSFDAVTLAVGGEWSNVVPWTSLAQFSQMSSVQYSTFEDALVSVARNDNSKMSPKRRRIACTQAEMTRALRAAKEIGGITVEITPDGAIRFEQSTTSEKSPGRRVDRTREIVL